MRGESRDNPWSRLVTGLVILAAGVIFWLDQIDRIDAQDYLEWWPLALIAIGLANLAGRAWAGGLVWILLGLFFMLPMMGYDRPSVWLLIGAWPLLISVAGVTLIIQALRPRPPNPSGGPGFRAVAVMAGNVRRIVMPTTGGEAVAVMGGCEIEISPEALVGNEMVIDVLTFWGGITIRIPYGWRLVNQVAPILGGLEDKTAGAPESAPRVVVRGSAIMAGVEVRNLKDGRG
jgi:hypothetical protein